MTDKKLLLLFDLDGTLITVNKNGGSTNHKRDIYAEVMAAVFSVENPRYEQVLQGDTGGLTDPLVIRKTLERLGVTRHEIDAKINITIGRIKQEIHRLTKGGIKSDYYKIIPGAMEAVERFRQANHATALCTGNLECVADWKLMCVGMDVWHFAPGAFGDDSADRSAIIEKAISRNSGATKEATVYFGDTPRDIEAAKTAGVASVAIAYTGEYSREELAEADIVIDSWELSQSALGCFIRGFGG